MVDEETVLSWFTRWMHYHQRLFQHLKGWVDPDDDVYYQGWVEALAKAGATEALAMSASRVLQTRKAFRSDHLAMILEIVGDLRRKMAELGASKAPAYTAEQVDAAEASASCPECEGRGWARRRFKWHSFPRPFVVDLYCRCPHGRWRRANDNSDNFDDLQGRPALWDPALSSPLWSDEPTPFPLIPDDPAGKWRYLGVGEAAPEPAVPAALAGKVAEGIRRVAPSPAPTIEQARQWAASPDRILAAEGARALAEAGEAPAPETRPVASPPRPRPPWDGEAADDDVF